MQYGSGTNSPKIVNKILFCSESRERMSCINLVVLLHSVFVPWIARCAICLCVRVFFFFSKCNENE